MVPVARVRIVVNTDVLSQEQGIFTVTMIRIKVKKKITMVLRQNSVLLNHFEIRSNCQEYRSSFLV